MYCSITFKGRKDPQDPKMVKLEMIFYKTGYTRIPRVVSITGAYKCWNNETLSFESASSEYLKKNQLLLELKEKYMSVAERWEKEWRNFSVLQWADCFKPKEEENAAVMRFLRCNCGVTKSVTDRVTAVHQKGKPSCWASASVISEKFSAPVSGLVTRSQPF